VGEGQRLGAERRLDFIWAEFRAGSERHLWAQL
jgi:hypothetical protein